MSDMFDLIIIGGGLNGPVLALAASQAGLSCALVDPADLDAGSDFDGRSYALSKGSQRLLNAVGLWDHLADTAQEMLEIKVSDARPGSPPAPQILHFQTDEIEDRPMGYMVEDRHLRAAYRTVLPGADGITRIKATATEQAVSPSGAEVTLDNGDILRGRLVIGCDGRRSQVATRAEIKRVGWDYGQTALVCSLDHALPHNGIAHQMFLPSGPLAILPLRDNRCSIVWSETDARAAELTRASDAGFMDALRPVFGDFLGEISLAGKRYSYPLGLTLAQSFAADRVALVGDAAHGMHPIAGQGLNAGLRDIASLHDVLVDARGRGEDIGSPLVTKRYEQARRFDVMRLIAATDVINRSFSNDNALLRPLRDLAMGAINGAPGLRRAFIREAAGLSGSLPSLMQP